MSEFIDLIDEISKVLQEIRLLVNKGAFPKQRTQAEQQKLDQLRTKLRELDKQLDEEENRF